MGNAARKLDALTPETADPAVVVNLAEYKHRRSRAACRSASGRAHLAYEVASDHGLYRYSAFGTTVEDTTNITQPLRWKARWYSPVAGGTYDVRARQWSPELGIFLSVDEFRYMSSRGTLWGWPGQNPIRYRDPSGRYAGGIVGVGVAVGIGIGGPIVFFGASAGLAAAGLWSAFHPGDAGGPSIGTGPGAGSGGGLPGPGTGPGDPSPGPGAGPDDPGDDPGDSGGGPPTCSPDKDDAKKQRCAKKALKVFEDCMKLEGDTAKCLDSMQKAYDRCMGGR